MLCFNFTNKTNKASSFGLKVENTESGFCAPVPVPGLTVASTRFFISPVSYCKCYNRSFNRSSVVKVRPYSPCLNDLMRVLSVSLLMLRIIHALPLKTVTRSFRGSAVTWSQSRPDEDSTQQKPKLTRIRLGSEEELQRAEMEERLKDSQRWVSKQLSDKEAEALNRALGIEKELLRGVSDRKTMKSQRKQVRSPPEEDDVPSDSIDMKRIRGFLELNPYICSGCGTNFQSKSAGDPGYLPPDKLQEHRQNALRIREQQEAVKILQMAGLEIGSTAADEVLRAAKVSEDTIRGVNALGGVEDSPPDNESSDVKNSPINEDTSFDALTVVDADYHLRRKEHYARLQDKSSVKKRVVDSAEPPSVCICQRCFRLQQYGQVEESLRPGWSENELLTPERFEGLLTSIKETEAVVLCIVDLFDLQGSLLTNLKEIAGKNPIVIAANKADLLPKDASLDRITGWIHAEVKSVCNLMSPKEKEEKTTKEYFARGWSAREKRGDFEGVLSRNNVHLVSCQTGYGMEKLMKNLLSLAFNHGQKVYVMGAANVGKSSFINRLLSTSYQNKKSKSSKSSVPLATVSNLPGTTLDFIKIRLPNGVTMIDTPGLINKGQLTSKLDTAELKQVIPLKPINAVTLRIESGKCVLIGGLARIELLDSRPFFLTFFISNEIKLHPTDSLKADEFIQKHIGSLVFPPASMARLEELSPFESKYFSVNSALDMVISFIF